MQIERHRLICKLLNFFCSSGTLNLS
jgi:hypothetical protein